MSDRSEQMARELVSAIRKGDTDAVSSLLAAEPGLANQKVPGNPRSMLHHATDWPGHRPNVATTIGLLVAAGADPNVTFPSPDAPVVAETPLHWAASADDMEALDALLDAGAVVDSLGGIFDGCTPYPEAVIFEKYNTARRLLEVGATDWLPGAAALGRTEAIDDFFDDGGNVRLDVGMLPHWTEPPDPQMLLDRAFQFACRAGHLEIAKLMLRRGADPSALLPGDTSALDEAIGNDHTEVVDWLRSLES